MDTATANSLFRRWIRATTVGWLIGFVLVVLLAMLWDTLGGGAQFMVGVGMGAGVGYLQSRVLRDWLERTRAWVWTSTLGMGAPFLLWDLSVGTGIADLFSLPVCVVTGSVLTGVLQHRLLRPSFERASWWIPACVAGWGLPVGIIALADASFLPPYFSAAAPIVMFFGGVLLGGVTGKTLQWMLPGGPPEPVPS